jgi:RimJ/RimL family protein N-acetyltransferase
MPKYPTELVPNVLPITKRVNQVYLNNKGLFVMEGLDLALAEQLIQASRQPHILDNCPRDRRERFSSVESIQAWQQKGRLALPLIKHVGDSAMTLVGFGWMGPEKPNEDYDYTAAAEITFAIRLYEEAVGQNNSWPFTTAMLDAHQDEFGNNGVWLETSADNKPALNTYRRAGFNQVDTRMVKVDDNEEERVLMILDDKLAA